MTSFAGLRIGLVGPLPPPNGGMANQTRQLAELLRADQALVLLVQSNAPYRPAWAGRLPVLRAAVRLLPYLVALWRVAGRSDIFHVMANSGWAWHLFAAPAIWIGCGRKVPVVVNFRGGEAPAFLERSQALIRWTMKRAARLAVPSAFLEGVFSRHGMPAEVLPNVVDLERFRPRGPHSYGDAPHLVVARNLEPIYDIGTALRAFCRVLQRYPNARMTVAGSGPEAPRLENLAVELGLGDALRFSGRLDREAMAALVADADLVLNPSLADNMPNSLLEAMACGVPVVSTDVGGIAWLVEHERTALLVAPKDAEGMAGAALRLLEDHGLWQRLSAAGLGEVQRYTWGRVAPDLARLYRSAISGSPAA